MDWRLEFLVTWERLCKSGFLLGRDETTLPALAAPEAEGTIALHMIERLQELEARLELLAQPPDGRLRHRVA